MYISKNSTINLVCCVGRVELQIEIKKGRCSANTDSLTFRALALRQRETVSLWRRANARNVRLYYPYWQYTDLCRFRFVKFAKVVTALLVEQYRNNTVIIAEHSLLFEQCCWALTRQQLLLTVIGTGENNIDRTSLFASVIIVVQPC